ncbi:multicopper oxidase domain-containing protein [Mesorhizobium sp.]|nr:multicopper oxidase domain-containing protein [Mesorhizobium sp.]
MRTDLILDMTGKPGSRISIFDRFYEGLEYELVDLVYSDTPLRARVLDWPLNLPTIPLPEPDLDTASRNEVVFTGGMMGEMVAQDMGESMGPGTMNSGTAWFINGVAADEANHDMKPGLTLLRNKSHVIATTTNATAWHDPIHLHGHSFRVISRNGQPTPRREWQDTALVSPREKVEIAFVADNPGNWMFHCHVLEHQAAGRLTSPQAEGEAKMSNTLIALVLASILSGAAPAFAGERTSRSTRTRNAAAAKVMPAICRKRLRCHRQGRLTTFSP